MLAVPPLPDLSFFDNGYTSRPAFVASYTESPRNRTYRENWHKKNTKGSNTIGAGAFSPGIEYGEVSRTTPTHNLEGESIIEASVKERREVLKKQWQSAVFDPVAATDVDTISATIESVFEYMSLFGAGSIDLSNLDPVRVNGEHLASVLRVTSHVKDKVRAWDQALCVAKEALLAAHQDPEDALFGLI